MENTTEAIKDYVTKINQQFATGNATEHSYRPALAELLRALFPKFIVTNEPRHIECGAPDFIIEKPGADTSCIPVFFVETKDVGDTDLDGNRQNKEQFCRYKNALDHVVFTDYLNFHFYDGGEFTDSVRIAEIKGNKIVLVESNIQKFFELLLKNREPQKITSPVRLAQMMANKAKLLANTIEQTLGRTEQKDSELFGQHEAFKTYLIHDLNEKQFADIYAQTICYGMFAARLYDETPDTFSRSEAAGLIPKTNPFLRKIFQSIAGYDVSESIVWIVDDLVETFRLTDMKKVMANFGKSSGQTDPMIHFYEDFLRFYDPKLKKACGVYYTPEPVVKFMVNAVDEILKEDFNLSDGLADTSKVALDRVVDGYFDKKSPDGKLHEKCEYHKVQILDPATGTGTFLVETIRKIHENMQGRLGAWQSYVKDHLLPRVNGFEFMMAPYAIAHLKLDMMLEETGYKANVDKRLRVFLTNSLEECDPDTGTLFAQWLAEEANEANYIKRDTPVMVMIGNPPYSVSSSNKGKWIEKLLEDYKKDLNERNIQPLSDDYIKFIRLGHYYVEKNGEGILAYISNNSFIDGIIHRQMRKTLMETFDSIYVLDLHGNSRKKEVAPDGSKDENVFDIMQGVSINIFVKKSSLCHSERSEESRNMANVFHYELYGKREAKYEYLRTHSFKDIPWQKLNPQEPQYFFVPKDFSVQTEYDKGFKINDLMKNNVSGVQTGRDDLYIDFDKNLLADRIQYLYSKNRSNEFDEKYKIKNSSGYNLLNRILATSFESQKIQQIYYRPFDCRFINYDENLIKRAFFKIQQHMLNKNICILCCKQLSSTMYNHILVSDKISDLNSISLQTKEQSYVFPLYLYPTESEAQLGATRKPNLDEAIWQKIDSCLDSSLVAFDSTGDFAHITTPEQIFDYIYGVLHTPSYREKYKEFLKIDFPRIPYPENKEKFNKIVELGTKLRKLHLMETSSIPKCQTAFDIEGDNKVTNLQYKPADTSKQINGRVYINDAQYFDNVPELAWNFYIGGYQPAQKWLKDRKGRTLSFDDVIHYQKIIAILLETDKLMKELDIIN